MSNDAMQNKSFVNDGFGAHIPGMQPARTYLAFFALILGSSLAACAAPADGDDTASNSAAQEAPSLTLAFDDDGRVVVPSFHGDPAKYHAGAHLTAGAVLVLENHGSTRRSVVVHFDGPPMLDEHHEIHTSQTVDLAPGESSSVRVPRSRGRYTFSCPAETDGVCKPFALTDGTTWRPMVGVSSS
jgi:hypothetical protein